MYTRFFLPSLVGSLLFFSACSVDTTGVSESSTRPPHPKSNPNASVVVTEFIDLQCEACRAAQTKIIEPMLAQYGDRIRYEVMHFPIFPNHRYSIEAAEAAECAADQGKFWEFEEMDYKNQDDLGPAALTQWAKDLKLDMDLYERCRKSNLKLPIIEATQKAGEDLGVNGTPTFFVNGQLVKSTIGAIGEAIENPPNKSKVQL